jgi:hypothetical protein
MPLLPMTGAIQDKVADAGRQAGAVLEREQEAYARDRPLGALLALTAAYGVAVAAGGMVVRRRGLPERIGWRDLALASVATYKLSRLLTKAPVTSPLRAPFTRFVGPAGNAELHEEVRGEGARKAVGELVTCPFCLGQWTGTAFVFGLCLAPRATRLVASVLTVSAAADFLQLAYAGAEDRT